VNRLPLFGSLRIERPADRVSPCVGMSSLLIEPNTVRWGDPGLAQPCRAGHERRHEDSPTLIISSGPREPGRVTSYTTKPVPVSDSSHSDTPMYSYHARVEEEAWARGEMARAAADPAAFERHLKERLEQRLAGRRRFQAHDNDGVWVEEVLLEGSYPDTTGAIILRDDRQPGCRFAWRLVGLWDWRAFQMAGADPDGQASWIEIELDEDVEAVNYGIPIRCLEGELTFMGWTEVSLNEAARRAPFPVLVPTRLPFTSELHVFYEERRRFRPFATLELVYRVGEGLLVSCQTERLEADVQDLPWDRVDRAVGDETFVMWALEHAAEPPFTVWHELDPVRTLGATFEGFYLYMQTDFLSRDDLLDMMASIEVVGREDDS
jgi:hypothetical protein